MPDISSPPERTEERVERVATAMLAPLGYPSKMLADAERIWIGNQCDDPETGSLAYLCRALARAALQSLGYAEMGWQLIETLNPRDPDGPEVHVLFWNGEHVTVGVRLSEDCFDDALWIDRDGDMNPVWPTPTHWMPLPEPPRTALRGDRERGEG